MPIGLLGKSATNVALDGGQQEALGRIFDGQAQLIGERGEDILLEFGRDGFTPFTIFQLYTDFENAFFFAAIKSQDLMRLETVDPAFEVVIGFVNTFLIDCIFDLDCIQDGELESSLTRQGTDIGVITDGLGNDVTRALQRIFDGGNLLVKIGFFNDLFEAAAGERLLEDMLRQAFQAFLAGDHGTRAALGLVGGIQVLEGGQGDCSVEGGIEFIGQLTLFLDGFQDGRAAFIHGAQPQDLIGDNAYLFIVERAGHFLAVAGDEGNGVAFVEQADGGLHLGGFHVQLSGDGFGVIHNISME